MFGGNCFYYIIIVFSVPTLGMFLSCLSFRSYKVQNSPLSQFILAEILRDFAELVISPFNPLYYNTKFLKVIELLSAFEGEKNSWLLI